MAEIKKYLDTTALGTLVDQIKAEDAKVQAAANAYADGLAKNYDAAGAAATAKSEAIADADAKFATVNENVAKKADTTALEAEVERATGKEAEIVASVEAVDAKADANAEAIAAINHEETGVLAQAKAFATSEDAKVQGNVDAVAEDVAELAEYVGVIPEGATATDIVGYVQEKTAGIATDAALGELQAAVDAVEADVEVIKGDYLKSADKTALEGKITAEAERAAAAEEANAAAINAVADDYLKGADKTELEGKIGAKADQTALDAEVEAREGAISGLQTQINTIMNNPDAEGAINSINEFTAYVTEHGAIADGFRTDINKNKEDIAAMDTAYKAADTAIKGRLDVLEAIDHDAYVAADTALETKLNGEIAKKADTTALNAAVEALEGVDAGQETRIQALEAKFTGDSSVEDQIADAKQEAIDAAAEDATTKANKALTDAKAYADAEDAKIEARVDALEAIDHEHANKAELDLITTGDKAKWDAAAAKAHEHANSAELAKVADGDVAKWNAAEQNAKTYADGLNTAMTAKVDGIDGRVQAIEGVIDDKAEQDDLDALIERVTTAEGNITANTSAINSFTPITSSEVEALFA